ncbi:hypothetical protein GJ654_11490 [Rhodoblastus acidophilus]|uniref:Sulfotransferase family protein n=1 Tax=Rhodoblastus acidophilus TaxID=1074 RepID=A0A6N8DQ00_RHOAC|nr:sulfotransferase [Rhodoblastus acidophilus]MCW2274660.1 LPS sulfotransferase NodH [Rhodoblastus acidophilus]MTV31615.1 hypothetical protein [Rhodoblastus acidophilus]
MKRFVIVGMPRTGSTLLSTGLTQHPQARCFAELFHPVDNERATHSHNLNIDGERVCFDPRRDDAIDFLTRYVFAERYAEMGAVGFKLFGDYVKGPGSEGLFRRLRAEIPDLHVIHICRRNYLEVLLSRRKASATGQWHLLAGKKEDVKSADQEFTIETAEAQRFFENMRHMDQFYETYFAGDRYCKVAYEDLEADFQNAMARVYAFLGLANYAAKPQTVKLRAEPPEKRIANYHALALAFQDSPFNLFFDDQRPRIAFPSDTEMVIGDLSFDLDASSAVHDKRSVGRRFVLMKRRRLIEEYVRLFDQLKPGNLFELGIRRGGSMAFYNAAFHPKTHVAIELETESIQPLDALVEAAAKDGRKMRPYFGVNQADKARLIDIVYENFGNSAGPLDLVIDDASHRLQESTASFEALFPLVREGGVYALEDWGWAHWTGFQGPKAYFSDQPALTNLVFRLVILHTCHPEIISRLVINPVVVYVERGPKALDPRSFNISDNLIMRGRNLVNI